MGNKQYSISHCNSREQQALLKLKNIIVSRCRPQLIYYLGCSSFQQMSRSCFSMGSGSRQWSFSCDMLIVLPTGTHVAPEILQEIENAFEVFEHINLMVHDLNFVVTQLQRYSLFFCWLQHHAMLLYEKDNASHSLPQPVSNIKQYALQAEEYLAQHPQYEEYLFATLKL